MQDGANYRDWDWKKIGITTLIAGVVTIVALAVYNLNFVLFDAITAEDGPVENGTAILYAASFLALVYALAQRRSLNVWIILLAMLFLAVAGEEISWGQRIFVTETPDLLRRANVQGEMNIHNISGIHQHVRALSVALLISLYVLLPVSSAFTGLRTLIARWRMPVPPPWVAVIALFALGYMAVPRALGHIDFGLDEMGELFFSITAFCFAFSFARRPMES